MFGALLFDSDVNCILLLLRLIAGYVLCIKLFLNAS